MNTGGPFFPFQALSENGSPLELFTGATLRDVFALVAMHAVYPICVADGIAAAGPDWRYGIALDFYMLADAMLRAREGQS